MGSPHLFQRRKLEIREYAAALYFLEESIRANTGWVVFEPNDESLWSRVKGTISLFLETQRRNGALMGPPRRKPTM